MSLDVPNILNKFSKTQRITALILLLITIIAISLGPSIIKGVAPDTKDLHNQIKEQRVEIDSLHHALIDQGDRIVDLNKKIVFNQQECTNSLAQREQEILQMIADLKKGFAPRTLQTEYYDTNDSGLVMMYMEVLPDPGREATYNALDALEKKVKKGCN
jgi:hypothetical protein